LIFYVWGVQTNFSVIWRADERGDLLPTGFRPAPIALMGPLLQSVLFKFKENNHAL
jgi:hypothetical protein